MSMFDQAQHPRFYFRISSAVRAVAIAFVAVLAPKTAMTQSQGSVLLSGSVLSYSESQVKEDGYALGFYGTYGAGWKHLFEVGASRTLINYLSVQQPQQGGQLQQGVQVQQNELAAAYNFFGARGSGRVGGHLVLSTDTLTDKGFILFGGARAYKVGVWSVGADAAWSSYADYGDGLSVAQVAPALGFSFANASKNRFVSVGLRGYFIHLSTETGLGGQDFLSAEAGASVTSGPFTMNGYAWGGEQAFAVKSGGFLAYNVSELHKGGYGGGVRLVVSPRAAVSAGVYFERFQDQDLSGDRTARTFAFSLGFTI